VKLSVALVAAAVVAAGFVVSSQLEAAVSDDRTVFCSEKLPNLYVSSPYLRWARQNSVERDVWAHFADAICVGQDPSPPSLVTAYGKSLIADGKMALPEQQVITTTTETLPPEPPSSGDSANIWVAPP